MEQQSEIRVLVVEPMKEPYEKWIPNTLEATQKEVGGYIEVIYPFEDEVGLICNEEGKLNGLKLNRALYDEEHKVKEIIAGKFLIVGLGEENFSSLTPSQVDRYTNRFFLPESFAIYKDKVVAIPRVPDGPKVHIHKGKNR